MKLFLVAENQVAQDKVLVRVRRVPGNSEPAIAGGKLQFSDPQVTRGARVQFKISLFDNEIVGIGSDNKCRICQSNPLGK